eukprot:TRINITY_DN30160_c0_g1_i1.p1 TRINITY_DN30160_c0_g1~~TRINITY_DN30160_c0_g1_i1.p1  ORF type:complete len:105 (+),score=4.52 TRINITY_DN30160_c0_g1_i1:514-828(+)
MYESRQSSLPFALLPLRRTDLLSNSGNVDGKNESLIDARFAFFGKRLLAIPQQCQEEQDEDDAFLGLVPTLASFREGRSGVRKCQAPHVLHQGLRYNAGPLDER